MHRAGWSQNRWTLSFLALRPRLFSTHPSNAWLIRRMSDDLFLSQGWWHQSCDWDPWEQVYLWVMMFHMVLKQRTPSQWLGSHRTKQTNNYEIHVPLTQASGNEVLVKLTFKPFKGSSTEGHSLHFGQARTWTTLISRQVCISLTFGFKPNPHYARPCDNNLERRSIRNWSLSCQRSLLSHCLMHFRLAAFEINLLAFVIPLISNSLASVWKLPFL